jgi:hypothetical protein
MREQAIAEQEANGERVDFYDSLEEAKATLASSPRPPTTEGCSGCARYP